MKRFDFEELIEKAFSMGYECALAEAEEKYFSKDEDDEKPKKKKLHISDRMDIWALKNFMSKKGRKEAIEDLDEKEPVSKLAKRDAIKAAKIGAGLGALSGGALGYISGYNENKKRRALKALKGAGVGAVSGAVLNGGNAALDTTLNTLTRRSARKTFKTSDDAWKEEQDLIRVADGQMSKEEFIKKWYK